MGNEEKGTFGASCDGSVLLAEPQYDVDGTILDNGIQLIGNATRQSNGLYTSLANVNGSLCTVEFKLTTAIRPSVVSET
jgi:hypothetical protein